MGNNGQKRYDEWSKETSIDLINRFNAPRINETEERFIQRANPKKILDVGSGNGVRLFEFLKSQNIEFIGLEKFPRLIDNSPYRESIKIGDITEIDISEFKSKGIDCITILGGTMNGIFGIERQKVAWQNISNILPLKGKVIFDVPLIEGFETQNLLGEMELFPGAPPQFFLSERELNSIWKECSLSIIEKENYLIQGPYEIRYYFLEKH